jgi:hypothetical protein
MPFVVKGKIYCILYTTIEPTGTGFRGFTDKNTIVL